MLLLTEGAVADNLPQLQWKEQATLSDTHLTRRAPLFQQGSSFWSVNFGASRDSSRGELYPTQIQFNHYVQDEFAVLFGISLGYAKAQRTDNALYIGPDLGLRWHFIASEPWSLYVDGNAGVIFHRDPIFSPDSLNFNFNLQSGFGMTYRLNERLVLNSGLRFQHLSNGRIEGKQRNISYNTLLGYVGFMFPLMP